MSQTLVILDHTNSVFTQILSELRDEKIQQDRRRFRDNIRKGAEILAYELSKHLAYAPKEVTTVLGTLEMNLLEESPVIISILRAGISMHNGFLNIFDRSDNGFISAYRHHTRGNDFIVKVEYKALPPVTGRKVILVDPMIATGKSIVLSYEAVVQAGGKPSEIYIAGIIASEQGIQYVRQHIPEAKIFVGAVDKELTGKAYIVPGLGDAGDLAFGPKE